MPNLYDFRILYGQSEDWQHFLLVHVPTSVQQAFAEGKAAGFNLASLELNSPVAMSFVRQPRYVIMGVEFHDGARVSCVPEGLPRLYWHRVALCALSLVVGGALAVAFHSLIAAAAAGALVKRYATSASRVPRKPTW